MLEPTSLLVKSANRKIADQTVECCKTWTIRQLKDHLSIVYPTKPPTGHQQIVFKGRLLQDKMKLEDIFRQNEPDQSTPTVHLICSPSSSESSIQENPLVNQPSSLEGNTNVLRQRHVQHTGLPTNQSRASTSNNENPHPAHQAIHGNEFAPANMAIPSMAGFTPANTAIPAMGGYVPANTAFPGMGGFAPANPAIPGMGGFAPATMPGGFVPTNSIIPGMGIGPYSTEQMMWMQHAYMQYMTQYMTHYMQGGYAQPDPATASQPIGPVHQEVPANQNVPPADLAAQRRPAPQQIRMNAQGGPVLDDDDEQANRDWLDWFYLLVRFGMLLSILYFYSTPTRFIGVISFAVLVYLYQGGWLRFQRRQQPENQPQQPDDQPPRQPDLQDPVNDEPADGVDGPNDDQPPPDTNPGAAVVQAQPLSCFALVWTIIVAFFSSLAPQPPPAINAN